MTAARVIGFSRTRILIREIFPNVLPMLIALISLEMGIAVIVEAILSFVGLSVSSDAPTWGGMIAQGRQIIHQGAWMLMAPLVDAVPDRARLQPARRGPAPRARPGAAPMSEPVLAVSWLSAISDRDRALILHDVSLTVDRAKRAASSARAARASRRSARPSWGFCRARSRVTAGAIRFEGQDLLTMPGARAPARRRADRADTAGSVDRAQSGSPDRGPTDRRPPAAARTGRSARQDRGSPSSKKSIFASRSVCSAAIRMSFPAACANAC